MASTNSIGGLNLTVTFTNGSAVIAATNTFAVNDSVRFTTTGSLPTNFSTGTTYYVISTGLSGSQFEVSATIGGSAITAGSAGSGTQKATRVYSDIASWLAAFTTGGWIGECYNDSEFTGGGDFSGHSTSATNYITLQTASGQSYRDNASVQTNAFAYNQSNGVGVKKNTAYATVFTINEDYVTIKNLQIYQQNISGSLCVENNSTGTTNCVLDSLIIESSSTGTYIAQMRRGLVRNCLLVMRHSSGKSAWNAAYGATTYANCTIVRPSNFTVGGNGFFSSGGSTITNCAVFGFTNFNTGSPSGSNNCSDVTIGFGTSNQASKTYANQFVTTTDTGRDFKIKTGADCVDNGATDTTDIPAAIDAVGTSRPQGSAWDIGAWELVASGAAFLARQGLTILQAPKRASYY